MFIVVFVIFLQLCNVEALTCLSCHGIDQPRHCHSVEKCMGNNAFCITDVVQNKYGQTVFNLGCTSTGNCHNVTEGVHASCRECCAKDLCNSEGCGQPGYPVRRGPVCYACPERMITTECMDIEYCQSDEADLDWYNETGILLTLLHKCNVLRGVLARVLTFNFDHNPVIVGKRSNGSRSFIYECDRCCSGDLCNERCPHLKASDCYDLLNIFGITVSGVYDVELASNRSVSVYCDMETSGGGWTVFQNRESADVNFYRNISQYVNGFGNLSGNFWLGLETTYEMTTSGTNSLYIKLEDANGDTYDDIYDSFSLSSSPNYTLHVGSKQGHLGTVGMGYHDAMPFSTFDFDPIGNGCGTTWTSGWWFWSCFQVSLNGKYLPPGTLDIHGIVHQGFHTTQSLKNTRMMFRRY